MDQKTPREDVTAKPLKPARVALNVLALCFTLSVLGRGLSDSFTVFLKPISDYLPLTFLNDALRQVATAGATLGEIRGDLVGIVAWVAVTFFLAFRFFRLEV